MARPVLIVQHEDDVEPGNFEDWLRDTGRPYEHIAIHAGDRLPASAGQFAGICTLGGTMSVNDGLPWINAELDLIRDADRNQVPVIGHCLGGQMIARAFDAPVRRADRAEIGWGVVDVVHASIGSEWVGVPKPFEVFQWHGDTFELPGGARRFLANGLCANQAFVIERPTFAHLAMQFHIEMTPSLVRRWIDGLEGAKEATSRGASAADNSGVQTAAEILDQLDDRAERMRGVAVRLYQRWARGLRD